MLRCSFSWLGDEVLHRELFWVLVHLGHVVPLPKGVLVEDNVAQHVSSSPRRIIELLHLAPGFIADENDLQSLEIELDEVEMRDLHVRDVVVHSEMMYCRLFEHSEMMYHRLRGWFVLEVFRGWQFAAGKNRNK